jgi:hypothetical protein
MKSINDNYNEEFASERVYDDRDYQPHNIHQIETLKLLEKIKTLEEEIETLKLQHNDEAETERYQAQFIQLQLENNLCFSRLNEEKYLLQIQMLQNK